MNAERLVAWLKNFDLSNPVDESVVTKRLEEILSDLGNKTNSEGGADEKESESSSKAKS